MILSKKHISSLRPAYLAEPEQAWRGLEIDYTTSVQNFAEIAHLADEKGCVVITKVELDSPAWLAGLRPRSFITHINDNRVTNPEQFHKLVATLDESDVKVKLSHGVSDQDRTKTISRSRK